MPHVLDLTYLAGINRVWLHIDPNILDLQTMVA